MPLFPVTLSGYFPFVIGFLILEGGSSVLQKCIDEIFTQVILFIFCAGLVQVQSCHHCLFGLRKCHTVPHSVLLTGKLTENATSTHPPHIWPMQIGQQWAKSTLSLSQFNLYTHHYRAVDFLNQVILGFSGLALTRFTVKGQISYSNFLQIQYLPLTNHVPGFLHGVKQIIVSYLQCDCCCKKMTVVLYSNNFLLFIHHDSAQMRENGILERNFSDTHKHRPWINWHHSFCITMYRHVYTVYQYCNFAYEMISSLVYPVKYPAYSL